MGMTEDFRSIVLNCTPLIDVRSPGEFVKGAFPNSVNLPLMSNAERHRVGNCYKEQGNNAAVALGHELVSGESRRTRTAAWCALKSACPDALLYCFRGGERSKIAQEWMGESGVAITRLSGGYKAFRRYLVDEIERLGGKFSPCLLGGRTGSGKTLLLPEIPCSIDLEGLANHRGSAFGQQMTPQPSQINFENTLAYALITKDNQGCRELLFEDESKHVGHRCIPDVLFKVLSDAPLVILETPMHKRVENICDEYVVTAQKAYVNANGVSIPDEWTATMQQAMDRIRRRLGGERHRIVTDLFEYAVAEQRRTGITEAHHGWIEYLLHEYYDPAYDYQLEQRAESIIFQGNKSEVLEYFRSNNVI